MPKPKVFQVQAILEGISPLKDGGMSLRFHTQEVLDVGTKTTMMNFYQDFGWLQFSSQELHEIPSQIPTREAGAKTPSQRLRGALLVLHRQRYPDMPSEVFYEQQMERIISKVKEQLT